MSLRLHDTLTRRLQTVTPLEPGHVRLYTCGPTVWNRAHIGKMCIRDRTCRAGAAAEVPVRAADY